MNVIEGVTNQSLGCAFISAACISRSYKVESSRNTVSLFMDISGALDIGTPNDIVSSILTSGRLLDLAIEVKNPDSIKDVYGNFRSVIDESAGESDVNSLWAALLASASVSQSSKVETIRETVAIWSEYRGKLPDTDPLDGVAVILARGRIIDLASTSLSFAEILATVENIKSELVVSGVREAGLNEIGAAFIAAAYITVTSKVETLKDIVATWKQVTELLDIQDDVDFSCALLTSGNVTDLNAMSILSPFSIPDQMKKLKGELISAGYQAGGA